MTPMCIAGVQQGWAIGVADCDNAFTLEYFDTDGVSAGSTLPLNWEPCIQGPPGPDWSPGYSNPAYLATLPIDFAAEEFVDIQTLTGDLTLTGANYTQPAQVIVRIVSDASSHGLTFPAGWTFVGAAMPVSIMASKTGLLTLYSFGTVEADVVAEWEEQP